MSSNPISSSKYFKGLSFSLTPGRKAPGENGPRRTGNNAENSSHSQCEVEVS